MAATTDTEGAAVADRARVTVPTRSKDSPLEELVSSELVSEAPEIPC